MKGFKNLIVNAFNFYIGRETFRRFWSPAIVPHEAIVIETGLKYIFLVATNVNFSKQKAIKFLSDKFCEIESPSLERHIMLSYEGKKRFNFEEIKTIFSKVMKISFIILEM